MIVIVLAAPFVALAISFAYLASVMALGERLEQRAQAGDVDSDGEIIDELRDRLDGAIGPTVDHERDDRLDIALLGVLRARPLAGEEA